MDSGTRSLWLASMVLSISLGRRSSDDKRQIKRWNNIVNRFKSILIRMIKNKNAKYNDYSISPKIRQILLHWSYELVENDLEK